MVSESLLYCTTWYRMYIHLLQCVALCCSVLQCVAVYSTTWYRMYILTPCTPVCVSQASVAEAEHFLVLDASVVFTHGIDWHALNSLAGNATVTTENATHTAPVLAVAYGHDSMGERVEEVESFCNLVQRCSTLQHIAPHCNTLQHTHQRTAMHCDALQNIATHCDTLRHAATHCNTCNTLRYTARASSSRMCSAFTVCYSMLACVLQFVHTIFSHLYDKYHAYE